MEFRVKRAPHIEAEITVPGDKSISHRAAIIAALSNGVCVLRGFLPSDDCMRTVQALRALGIKIEQPEPNLLVVHGNKRLLKPPSGPIDCGNSATTMRLLTGLLGGSAVRDTFGGRRLALTPANGSRLLRHCDRWVHALWRRDRTKVRRCVSRDATQRDPIPVARSPALK